jgi:hypothetical protein
MRKTMTISELMKTQWVGGRAIIVTRDGQYKFFVTEKGEIVNRGDWSMPADILYGDEWELKYDYNYSTEAVISALSKLNPDITALHRSEWNGWANDLARETIHAIARALNYKIDSMRRV